MSSKIQESRVGCWRRGSGSGRTKRPAVDCTHRRSRSRSFPFFSPAQTPLPDGTLGVRVVSSERRGAAWRTIRLSTPASGRRAPPRPGLWRRLSRIGAQLSPFTEGAGILGAMAQAPEKSIATMTYVAPKAAPFGATFGAPPASSGRSAKPLETLPWTEESRRAGAVDPIAGVSKDRLYAPADQLFHEQIGDGFGHCLTSGVIGRPGRLRTTDEVDATRWRPIARKERAGTGEIGRIEQGAGLVD